jgi:hypothetical protein
VAAGVEVGGWHEQCCARNDWPYAVCLAWRDRFQLAESVHCSSAPRNAVVNRPDLRGSGARDLHFLRNRRHLACLHLGNGSPGTHTGVCLRAALKQQGGSSLQSLCSVF